MKVSPFYFQAIAERSFPMLMNAKEWYRILRDREAKAQHGCLLFGALLGTPLGAVVVAFLTAVLHYCMG